MMKSGRADVLQAIGGAASTRIVGLIRLSLGLLLWAEYGRGLLLFRDLRPLPFAIAVAFFAVSPLMVIGWHTRASTLATALAQTAVVLYLGNTLGRDFVHHHTFLLLIANWILVLAPAGRSYSWDRVRALARGASAAAEERGPVWPQRLLAVHVSTVYVWAAFDKLGPAFLGGARLEHYYLRFYGGAEYPSWPGFHAAMVTLAWATVALELSLGVGLWFARARGPLMLLGALFHAALYVALPVETFSLAMLVLYLAFLDPDAVHRALDRLHAPSPGITRTGSGEPPPRSISS